MSTAFCAPADELAGLNHFLDAQRASVVGKLAGLSDEDAARTSTVSSLTPLTIVKHLAFCERRWFELVVAGNEIPGLYPPPDDREMRVEPDDTVESITALYEGIVERSREIVATCGDPGADGHAGVGVNVRWVLLHMIEETARHAGHLDIIRESIDGVVGLS